MGFFQKHTHIHCKIMDMFKIFMEVWRTLFQCYINVNKQNALYLSTSETNVLKYSSIQKHAYFPLVTYQTIINDSQAVIYYSDS